MTATHVNGVAVVADEPAQSPISRPGVHVTFDQIRHLLLADGNEWYGCVHCEYVSQNINSIRPHLKVHKPKSTPGANKPKKPVGPKRTAVVVSPNSPEVPSKRRTTVGSGPTGTPKRDLASLSLGELVERAQLTEQMRMQRDAALARESEALGRARDWKDRADDWRVRFDGMKDRAEAAESRLRKVRALVKG